MARHGWRVLKLGGELLEDAERLRAIAAVVARVSSLVPLAVVHGGGREIDAALARAGIEKRQVDGLRVTDRETLDVVVSVLAGTVNTRFVAAIGAAGGQAVGLTGADAGLAMVERAAPLVSAAGATVDLGLVGEPIGQKWPRLLVDLGAAGYVPVIASLGVSPQGEILNVNADTLAAHLAGRLGAARFVVAGTTAGVLDEAGRTIDSLDREAVGRLVASGVASAGMIAKLRACEDALANGASEVVLIDGRDARAVETMLIAAPGEVPAVATTRMVA
jgi:acetylglutamate kinase